MISETRSVTITNYYNSQWGTNGQKDRLDEFLFGICIVKTILSNVSLIKEHNFSLLKDLFLTKEMTSRFFFIWQQQKKILFQLGSDF